MQYPAVVESSHFKPGKFEFAYFNYNYYENKKPSIDYYTYILYYSSSFIDYVHQYRYKYTKYILPVPISIRELKLYCIGMRRTKKKWRNKNESKNIKANMAKRLACLPALLCFASLCSLTSAILSKSYSAIWYATSVV